MVDIVRRMAVDGHLAGFPVMYVLVMAAFDILQKPAILLDYFCEIAKLHTVSTGAIPKVFSNSSLPARIC